MTDFRQQLAIRRIQALAARHYHAGDTLKDADRIECSFGKEVADYFRTTYPNSPCSTVL